MRQLSDERMKDVTPYEPRVVDLIREQAPLPGELRGCRDCCYRSGEVCSHPSVGSRKLNVFSGTVERVNLPKFKTLRLESGICGPEGRLWSKVPPHSNYRFHGTLALVSAVSGVAGCVWVSWWSLLFAIPFTFCFGLWLGIGSEPES